MIRPRPVAALVVGVATACGGHAGVPAPDPTATGTRPSAAPAAGGAGAYLAAPTRPVTIAASDDCRRLVVDSAEQVGACATATTAKGTITAVVVFTGHDKHVDVYRRDGAHAVLVLTGLETGGTDGSKISVGTVDPAHDGFTKIAVVLLPRPSGTYVGGYDLVDAPGVVALHRSLGQGAVAEGGGGLVDDARTGTSGSIVESTLVFADGSWRVARQRQVTAYPDGPADRVGTPV